MSDTQCIEKNHSLGGRARGLRITISDMIYILDIQNKNPDIQGRMAKYGLNRACLAKVKDALQRGRWQVCGQ